MAGQRPGLTRRVATTAVGSAARSLLGAKLAVIGGVVALVLVIALFLFLAIFGVLLGDRATGQTVNCGVSAKGTSEIPARLLPIYRHAAGQYRLGARGPSVLAAINKVETAFGTNTNDSSAGAQGWMQFIPSTWQMYGVDADGDGRRDPASPADAIHAAARYLHAAGAPANWYRAVFSYNHADWYVQAVLKQADAFKGSCTATVADGPAVSLAHLDYSDTSGAWGGSEKFAKALARTGSRSGCMPTSEKRTKKNTASGLPSDHWVGSRLSYAVDLDSATCTMAYPGGDADRTAKAIAATLGMPTHTGIVTVIHGAYRFQLIWQAAGHYDHIHIGVKRIGQGA